LISSSPSGHFGSGEHIESDNVGPSGHFAQSQQGVMCEDLNPRSAGRNYSEILISFDFIDSINFVGSSQMIESDNVGSSEHSLESRKGVMSEDLNPSSSGRYSREILISFDFINSINIVGSVNVLKVTTWVHRVVLLNRCKES
jgi:hypothetical protein